MKRFVDLWENYKQYEKRTTRQTRCHASFIVAFDDNPNNLIGAKYFFERIVLSGFWKVFYLEIINRCFKRKIRQSPREDKSDRGNDENNNQGPAEYPHKQLLQ